MTQDEIIEMAVSNGFYKNDEGTITSPFIEDVDISELLLGFAEDVAAKEREACIVDIQMHIPRSGRDTLEYKMAMRMIERIKARGEA